MSNDKSLGRRGGTKHLALREAERVPAELSEDPVFPGADRFYAAIDKVERTILHYSRALKVKEVKALKLRFKGVAVTSVGKEVGMATETLRKLESSVKGSRLLALMSHLEHLRDGPRVEHRRNLLYRIAADNELNRPRIAVAALQELNKMAGLGLSGAEAGGGVNITINNELFPRGALDVPPVSYEARERGAAEELVPGSGEGSEELVRAERSRGVQPVSYAERSRSPDQRREAGGRWVAGRRRI